MCSTTRLPGTALYITLKDGQMVVPADNIMTPAVRAKFSANFIDNLDGDAGFKFNLDLNHWFYALPRTRYRNQRCIAAE